MTGSSADPAHRPLIIAVTPCHNRRTLTVRFVKEFAKLSYPHRRLIVVDDGSTDGTTQAVRALDPAIEVVTGDGNLWWTGATNLGIRHALAMGADYILTINDDATFGPDLLERLVEVAMTEGGRRIVGSRLMRADDPVRVRALGTTCVFRGYDLLRLNHMDAPWEALAPTLSDPLPVDTMPGNGVLLPRAVFEEVGLYDQQRFPHNHADSDLVLRARQAGFTPVIAMQAVVFDEVRVPMVVQTLRDALWSRRSDRYLPALRTLLRRHGPRWGRWRLLVWQYAPFCLPLALRERLRSWRAARRRARAEAA